MPDPADKALINQLKREKEAAIAALFQEKLARKHAEKERDAESERADINYKVGKKLQDENAQLKHQLQAKQAIEVIQRVNTLYMFVGDNGMRIIDSSSIRSYVRRAKESGSLGIISKFLAQDFSNPATAAVEIENKLQEDYSQADNSVYIPKDATSEWWERSKNERIIKFRTTAESDEWRNTRNDHTLSQTQLQCVKSLGKMRFESGPGGPQEDQKRQIKP